MLCVMCHVSCVNLKCFIIIIILYYVVLYCTVLYYITGLYVASNQMQINQAAETRAESVKTYEEEFERLARKEAKKKNKREVSILFGKYIYCIYTILYFYYTIKYEYSCKKKENVLIR